NKNSFLNLYQLPPKKPPRTFEHDRKKDNLKKLIDQQVPSSESSNENSPIFDRVLLVMSSIDDVYTSTEEKDI
ncbi:unnamed protein product, partial [Rotaria sp. Silwood1]